MQTPSPHNAAVCPASALLPLKPWSHSQLTAQLFAFGRLLLAGSPLFSFRQLYIVMISLESAHLCVCVCETVKGFCLPAKTTEWPFLCWHCQWHGGCCTVSTTKVASVVARIFCETKDSDPDHIGATRVGHRFHCLESESRIDKKRLVLNPLGWKFNCSPRLMWHI